MDATTDHAALAVSIRRAAALIGVSTRTLKNEMAAGRVPHRKFANRTLIPLAWIYELTGWPMPEREITLDEAIEVVAEAAKQSADLQRLLRDLPVPR